MDQLIYILQVGGRSWSEDYSLPENLVWHTCLPDELDLGEIKDYLKSHKQRSFAGIIVEDASQLLALEEISSLIDPYTVFYNQHYQLNTEKEFHFLKKTCARTMDFSDKAAILHKFSKGLFKSQYGDKFSPSIITIQPHFQGEIEYNGHQNLILSGEFGSDFKPLLFWPYNKTVDQTIPQEFWLEYQKEGDCEIRLRFTCVYEGSLSDIASDRIVTEEEMQEAIIIDYDFSAYISVSLEARGRGCLQIGALHARFSRYDLGKFTMGGGILSDHKRQEINYYFHPGDLKPPLAIYFSGYRPAEGFEGFGMMRTFGSPFLLFQDPRIEGGAFYMGSQELESKVKQVIVDHLAYLGFTEKDLIFSGMSMGTYGALFYGADFNPQAIIVSKPLVNLGNIAKDAKLSSPGVFPTSFDILRLHTGGNGPQEIQALNQRFWNKFEAANFQGTIFAIAYMRNEDYDQTAYDDLLAHLYDGDAKLISKGFAGRHMDDTVGPVTWFVNQYKEILYRYFGREIR